jgi:hypothetical protein
LALLAFLLKLAAKTLDSGRTWTRKTFSRKSWTRSIESNIGGTKTYINASCFAAPAVFSSDDPVGVGFGDAGVGILMSPGQQNFDLSLIKRFPITWPRESATLEFRSEFYNAFNHPQFGNLDTEFTSPTFGQISSTVVNPRVVQLALKLSF